MSGQTLMLLLGAYLLGSIPAAYLVTRYTTGEDIRYLGNGNVGAKNTYESVGKQAGFAVAVFDVGKGILTVAAARYLSFSEGVILLAGACVVLGHDFSIFLGFQGGQGMAATVGVFSVLFPQVTLLALAASLLAFALTRNWDLSCGIGFFILVAGLWFSGHSIKKILFTVLLLPLIGIKKLLQVWQARRLAA